MSKLYEKIKQVEALEIGLGFNHLLNAAYKIIGNPLLLHDMEYNLIGYSEEDLTDDTIWNEFLTNGTLCKSTLEFCKNEGFIDGVANANIIALLKSDGLRYDRFVGKIFSKDNITVAYLLMVASNRPFEAYDSLLFEAVCEMFSKEAATNESFKNYAQEYQDSLIARLIGGDIEDKALYAGHMANIYRDWANFYVGVADIARCNFGHAELVYLRDLCKQTQPAFKYSVYADSIVFIIYSEHATLDVKRDLHKLNKLFRQKNIYVGISNSFENIYEFGKYYGQALDALNSGMKYYNRQWIFLYNELVKAAAIKH